MNTSLLIIFVTFKSLRYSFSLLSEAPKYIFSNPKLKNILNSVFKKKYFFLDVKAFFTSNLHNSYKTEMSNFFSFIQDDLSHFFSSYSVNNTCIIALNLYFNSNNKRIWPLMIFLHNFLHITPCILKLFLWYACF